MLASGRTIAYRTFETTVGTGRKESHGSERAGAKHTAISAFVNCKETVISFLVLHTFKTIRKKGAHINELREFDGKRSHIYKGPQTTSSTRKRHANQSAERQVRCKKDELKAGNKGE